MQTMNRKQLGALLAGAGFFAAIAFAAPSEAFAACGGGTGGSTGTHAPSAGGGGINSGSHPSAGSGASGCGVNTTTSAVRGVGLAPSLAGVHGAGAIAGNGGKRNGSTTGNTANTIIANTHNTTTHTTSASSNVTRGAVVPVVHTASGGAWGGHSFHGHRRP